MKVNLSVLRQPYRGLLQAVDDAEYGDAAAIKGLDATTAKLTQRINKLADTADSKSELNRLEAALKKRVLRIGRGKKSAEMARHGTHLTKRKDGREALED